MGSPEGYPPTHAAQGPQSLIIAAPGEPLAEALATELRALGWRVVVAEQLEPYAREARVAVAPLTPATINNPALAAALATLPAPLIPLLVGVPSLPPGRWATPPVVFAGDPAQAARDIAAAANSLASAPATIPATQPPETGPAAMSGYTPPATPTSLPPADPTMPYTPALPSQPLQPYQTTQGYPTQAGYTQYPQGSVPYSQPPAPKKRRWPVIVGVIVAVVLLLCVAGGAFAYKVAGQVSATVAQTATASAATDTPVPTATPSLPADFTVYTDATNGYSIAYPQSWQKNVSGGGVIFLDLTDGAQLWLIPASDTIPQSEIKSVEAQMFKSAGVGSYTNVQGPTEVTYAGETWEQESADSTTGGQSLHAVVLIANHGSKAYMIFYAAAKSDFASLDTQDFQPMLNSLSFLS